MIQIAITAFIVWALFKFLDKEGYVDGFASIAFVLVPAIFLFLVSIAIKTFELPNWILLVCEISYFLVPMLMLKAMTEFAWPKIIGFSAIVLAANICVQVAFMFLFASTN